MTRAGILVCEAGPMKGEPLLRETGASQVHRPSEAGVSSQGRVHGDS